MGSSLILVYIQNCVSEVPPGGAVAADALRPSLASSGAIKPRKHREDKTVTDSTSDFWNLREFLLFMINSLFWMNPG